MAIRSGTFSFDVEAGTDPGDASQRIVYATNALAGSIYRVFNSSDRANPSDGRMKITNAYDGDYTEVDQQLFPTMSIDIAVGPSNDATSNPAGLRVVNGVDPSADTKIRGSYDLVRDKQGWISDAKRRSGRFNFPARVPNGFLPVMVADLSAAAAFPAMYRFHNTGEGPYQVFVAEADSSVAAARVLTATVDSHEAVDIYVPADGDKRRIFVQRVATKPPHISGIFEMIG